MFNRSNVITRAALCAVFALNFALNPALAQTPTQAPGCANVEVHHVRPQQGNLMIAAYGDAESYDKKPLVSLRLAAGEGVTRFQLCGLSGSEVALALFQDLDSDGRMGRNLMGMPTEPWGSSGTPGTFGPSWDTGKTALNGSAIIVRLSQ